MMRTIFLLGVGHFAATASAFCVLPIRSRDVVSVLRSSNPKGEWNDFLSNEENELNETPKLGIDLQLNALTPEQVAELKAELSEMVSDKVAAGIDEIQRLRQNLAKEMEASQRTLQLRSELRAKEESSKLLNKIDQLTNNFLSETEAARASTKMAASADRAMEGKGIEVGVWGEVKGAAVLMSPSEDKLLLGSVAAAQNPSASSSSSSEDEIRSNEKRVLIVADPTQVSPTSQ